CISFFFSSRRRHTRSKRDWSSDVCSSDLSYVSISFSISLGRKHSLWFSSHFFQFPPNLGVPHMQEQDLPLHLGQALFHHVLQNEIGRASCREKWRSRWCTAESEGRTA